MLNVILSPWTWISSFFVPKCSTFALFCYQAATTSYLWRYCTWMFWICVLSLEHITFLDIVAKRLKYVAFYSTLFLLDLACSYWWNILAVHAQCLFNLKRLFFKNRFRLLNCCKGFIFWPGNRYYPAWNRDPPFETCLPEIKTTLPLINTILPEIMNTLLWINTWINYFLLNIRVKNYCPLPKKKLIILWFSKEGLVERTIWYRVFIKYCVFPKNFVIFLNSASSAEALVFYLPGVCTHTYTKGNQRKARVRNILKYSKKHNI